MTNPMTYGESTEEPNPNLQTNAVSGKKAVTDPATAVQSLQIVTDSRIDGQSNVISGRPVTHSTTDGETTEGLDSGSITSRTSSQSSEAVTTDPVSGIQSIEELSTELATSRQTAAVSEGPEPNFVTDEGPIKVTVKDAVSGSQSTGLPFTNSVLNDYSTITLEGTVTAPVTDGATTIVTPATDSITRVQSTKASVADLLTGVTSTEKSSTDLVTDGQTTMASEEPETVTLTGSGLTHILITDQETGSQSVRPAFTDSITEDYSTVISEKPVTAPVTDGEVTIKAQVTDSITSTQPTYVSTSDLTFSVQSTKHFPTEQKTGGQTAVLSEGRGIDSLIHEDSMKIPVTAAVTGSQSSKIPVTFSLTGDQMTAISTATITNTVTYDRTTDDAVIHPTTDAQLTEQSIIDPSTSRQNTIVSEALVADAESTESPETDPKTDERSTITVRKGISDTPATTSILTSSLSSRSNKTAVKPVKTTKSTTEKMKHQSVNLAKGLHYFL